MRQNYYCQVQYISIRVFVLYCIDSMFRCFVETEPYGPYTVYDVRLRCTGDIVVAPGPGSLHPQSPSSLISSLTVTPTPTYPPTHLYRLYRLDQGTETHSALITSTQKLYNWRAYGPI